jgi:integrase
MGVKVREHKGAWWLFIDYHGKRKAKRVGVGKPGKRSAEQAAIRIQAKLAEDDTSVFNPEPPAAATCPTFAAVADEWLVKYPAVHAVAPSTMENYTSFTQRHLVPFFGAMPVIEITADTIEDFIAAKRSASGSLRFVGKPLSDATLRTGLLALRLILQRAVRMKLIPGNPVKEVEWRGSPSIAVVDPFSGRELREIIAAAERLDPDIATMLSLWAQSGMRAGEVCGLQWGDLDLERGTALVQRTWTRERLGPTKTRQSRLVSFLHPVLDDSGEWRPGSTERGCAVLHALRGSKVRSLDPQSFVFGHGARPVGSMELHRRWKRVLVAAKVRYRSPEQLRHTFASTMLSRNAPLLYVQQQGGWRSAAVLLRVYARWMPQDAATSPAATLPQPRAVPAPARGPVSAG